MHSRSLLFYQHHIVHAPICHKTLYPSLSSLKCLAKVQGIEKGTGRFPLWFHEAICALDLLLTVKSKYKMCL